MMPENPHARFSQAQQSVRATASANAMGMGYPRLAAERTITVGVLEQERT